MILSVTNNCVSPTPRRDERLCWPEEDWVAYVSYLLFTFTTTVYALNGAGVLLYCAQWGISYSRLGLPL